MLRKTSFLLLAIVILVMVAATLIEKQSGTATMIYGAWWFAALWALLAVCALCYGMRRRLFKRPATLLLHLSLVVILAGALITHLWGEQGTVHLRLGQPSAEMLTADRHVHQLPFLMQLEGFEVTHYPGTLTPMDYTSRVICPDDTLTISMNHIGEYRHYRFYQSAYDPDEQGTVLAVSHDPWGIAVTYTGYGLLFLSMLLLLILPNEGLRRALRKEEASVASGNASEAKSFGTESLRALAIAAVFLFNASSLQAAPKAPSAQEAHSFCSLYAYYNGRICPMQTVAKDFTLKLYGRDHAEGYNFEQVFTGWLFYPTTWDRVPRKERKERYHDEQEALIQMFLAGELTRIFPCQGQWFCPADQLPAELPSEQYFFIKKGIDYLGELTVTGQHQKWQELVGKIRTYQQQEAGDVLPSEGRFEAEKVYNVTDYTRPLAMGFATLGIVLFVVVMLMQSRQRTLPRWLTLTPTALVTAALLYLMLRMALRWYVSQHLPLSNGYETMQFMALCVSIVTLLMRRRMPLALPFGCLLMGLTLLVSMMGEANPQITLLMPVLQSPLLSLHVCIIMVSYTLLAFTFLNAIAFFILDKRTKGQKDKTTKDPLTLTSRLLLYPALFCLAAGIFIGAIWANVSWGRYWGWDPKEVWALITLLLYSFALHGESLPLMRRPRIFHLFMILAFLSVLMTYFGVNFLLGGMHSYANS